VYHTTFGLPVDLRLPAC
jgi:hypothetical protein